jgi:histidyl-tRNA synthetase
MENKPMQDRNVKEITEAGKIARFYGFRPITPPAVTKQDFESVKNFEPGSFPAEKASLLGMYFDEKMMSGPQPSMFFCERPFPGLKEKKKPLRFEASLVSMGSSKSVCECLSIQTGIAILNEIGHKNVGVEINSIGDKDSMNEFQKKLTAFVRKNFNSFPADLRQATKEDLFAILKEQKEEWQNFQAECPKSIDFLSESSRLHFKEVLEFLEIMEIPYNINNHLVGDLDIGSETIFSIKTEGEELAYGFRFNRMAKKIGQKKELPCTILNISVKLKKKLKKVKAKITKPQFYLVQFGSEAKLKSFIILEELYKAGGSVIHAITKDKLSSQMGVAENSAASYIILIGQKEALDNAVVVRNTLTHAQEIVPICEFSTKIKAIIKTGFA